MKKTILAASLLVALHATAQTFKPAVTLGAGQKYNITTVAKGSMSQELMGQSMEIPVDVTATSVLEVKKADKKTYDLTSTATHIIMNMSMMGQAVNYDSDKKEDSDGELGQALGGGLNKPTTFSVNSFGKIIEGSIKKTESPEKDAPGSNMMMGMMNMGKADEISPAIDLFASDAAIKVGDSFTDSSSSADGKDKKSTTYTLAEVNDTAAKFIIAGTMAAKNEAEMQGMQTTSTTNTKITGEMWISKATGLLTKKVLTMNITGTVEVAGMSIPLTGTNTVTITVSGQ